MKKNYKGWFIPETAIKSAGIIGPILIGRQEQKVRVVPPTGWPQKWVNVEVARVVQKYNMYRMYRVVTDKVYFRATLTNRPTTEISWPQEGDTY